MITWLAARASAVESAGSEGEPEGGGEGAGGSGGSGGSTSEGPDGETSGGGDSEGIRLRRRLRSEGF